MSTIRRLYIYLVSAINLQAITWAAISLLRNLFISNLKPEPNATAFQIAVLIIGTPFFVGHWYWGQRLTRNSEEERESNLRRLYLYGILAGFLAPFLANMYDLIGGLINAKGSLERLYYQLDRADLVPYNLIAIIVLSILWYYHYRILTEDQQIIPSQQKNALIRRFYILGFSVLGLYMTGLGGIHILRWIMLQFGTELLGGLRENLADEITRLLIGLPVWVYFWRWAARLFESGSAEEERSALRKFYIYGAVFAGALGVVANSATILAAGFRSILGLSSQGDIRGPLPIIIVMGVLWTYHALVLREDSNRVDEAPRQAAIRRLYLYLLAFIGFSAVLIGLAGVLSVILRTFDQTFGNQLREQLSWFAAALLSGLPVWILPWRQLQLDAQMTGSVGADSRRSIVRRMYLYFFLFVASITVLSGAVYIVYSLLTVILKIEPPSFSEVAQAIAYAALAVGVWIYHGITLRNDSQLTVKEQVHKLVEMNILVLDIKGGGFANQLVETLQHEYPELELSTGFIPTDDPEDQLQEKIKKAGLIIAPWNILLNDKFAVSAVLDKASAQKLLAPGIVEGWNWAGVEGFEMDDLLRQVIHAVRLIASGKSIEPDRPMGIGTIIAIGVGILIVLGLIAIPVINFFESF